jgi:excisionase family DNA binding protein
MSTDSVEKARSEEGAVAATAPNSACFPEKRPKVPRFALSKAEAAESLGVSVDFFEEHVMAELRIVRRGRRRLIPVRELEAWLDRSAARTLEDR